MRLSVVGVGYVGLVAAGCLADVGNEVICIDNDKNKISDLKKGIIPIYEPGLTEIIKRNEAAGRLSFTTNLKEGIANSTIIFLAVGTPSSADGSADISAVLSVCKDIADLMDSYKIIVTKSTVPVGTHKKVHEIISSNTTESFGYVSNPEFLKEGSAVEDFMKPDRIIIGTDNAEAREQMNFLYSPFMRKKSKVIFMDAASAELTKYAANCMLATRISFMNELSGLCEQVGADIESVRTGIGSDSRIGNAFLFPGVGFGGSCFPKDVRALIHTGNENDNPMTIVDSVQKANIRQQERFAQKVIDYYSTIGEKITLAVWGLSFKARTDDVRESPAIYCIEKFIEAGIAVKAYDPEAMGPARALLADQIEYSKDSYKALENCDGLVILTDWQEFRNPDFETISTNLKNAIIFDGRNLYDPAYIKKQGIEYHSIGR